MADDVHLMHRTDSGRTGKAFGWVVEAAPEHALGKAGRERL